MRIGIIQKLKWFDYLEIQGSFPSSNIYYNNLQATEG